MSCVIYSLVRWGIVYLCSRLSLVSLIHTYTSYFIVVYGIHNEDLHAQSELLVARGG